MADPLCRPAVLAAVVVAAVSVAVAFLAALVAHQADYFDDWSLGQLLLKSSNSSLWWPATDWLRWMTPASLFAVKVNGGRRVSMRVLPVPGSVPAELDGEDRRVKLLWGQAVADAAAERDAGDDDFVLLLRAGVDRLTIIAEDADDSGHGARDDIAAVVALFTDAWEQLTHAATAAPCFLISDVLLDTEARNGTTGNQQYRWHRQHSQQDSVFWNGWRHLGQSANSTTSMLSAAGLYDMQCFKRRFRSLLDSVTVDEWITAGDAWWRALAVHAVPGYRVPLPLITVNTSQRASMMRRIQSFNIDLTVNEGHDDSKNAHTSSDDGILIRVASNGAHGSDAVFELSNDPVHTMKLLFDNRYGWETRGILSRRLRAAYAWTKRRYSPLISVIIPFYNVRRTSWLFDMFRSLWRQTMLDFEVIVVDDGSDGDVARVFLRQLGRYLTRTGNWWHADCDFKLESSLNDNEMKSKLSDAKQLNAHSIPMYLVRHERNHGLAAARNTGVAVARAPTVFFLDPDDLLAPHALESMILAAFGSLLPEPTQTRTNARLAFLHPAVVHFSGDSPNWAQKGSSWAQKEFQEQQSSGKSRKSDQKSGSKSRFREPVTRQVPFDAEQLKVDNLWTSAALIHRQAYIDIGGMCTRKRGLKYFEDWEFWMRMVSFGYTGGSVSGSALNARGDVQEAERGKSIGEGLFWYRRHDEGQSAALFKLARQVSGGEQVWMDELRQQSPVLFDQMSARDVELLMWQRLKYRKRKMKPMVISKRDEMRLEMLRGVLNDTAYLPCYQPFETDELIQNSETALYKMVMQHAHQFPFTHQAGDRGVNDLSTTDDSDEDDDQDSPEAETTSIRTYSLQLFPFLNPELDDDPRPRALYLNPWAVTGGADIYDLQVLRALYESGYRTSLLYARTIPVQQQTLLHNFTKWTVEQVNLQLISNDTATQELALEYFITSRNVKLLIFRASVVGYQFLNRWQKLRCTDALQEQHSNTHRSLLDFIYGLKEAASVNRVVDSLKIVDINHLQIPSDKSGWEWRSGLAFCALNQRVVVSEDLKHYLLNIVKDGSNSTLTEAETPIDHEWNHETEAQRIRVIYPPALLDDWSIDMLQNSSRKETNQANIYFFGRLEMQKDPILWLLTAQKSEASFKFHLFGSGSLSHQLRYDFDVKNFIAEVRLNGPLEHGAIGRELANNPHAILLTTSRYDGVSMIMLEALAFGVPVVALDCSSKTGGGIRELLKYLPKDLGGDDDVPMLTLVEPDFDDTTEPLNRFEGSVCHFNYETTSMKLHDQLVNVRDRMLRQTAVQGDSAKAHLYRFQLVESFRHRFNGSAFRDQWRQIFHK